MKEPDKFHIELALVREDSEEGTHTDKAITIATVFSEADAEEAFTLYAAQLGTEDYVRSNGDR